MKRAAIPTKAVTIGRRRAVAALATQGGRIAAARVARDMTQAQLARHLGVAQSRISQIEAGAGDGVPAHLWFSLADVLGLPFRFEFGRDPLQQLEDAGHLDLQEFMLDLAAKTGRRRGFELGFPGSSRLSVDVGVRDDRQRVLLVEECWNTFSNLGASVRNTHQKLAEMEALAVAVGGEGGPYLTAACWVVRDVPRNRTVVENYPSIFRTTFAGSRAWIKALTEVDNRPPAAIGFVWCDPRRKTLSELRV